jgi:hypothetical protein
VAEPADFCFRCDLPLFMCAHGSRAASPGRPVVTVEPDWDHVEELAAAAAGKECGPSVPATYDQSCPGCAGRIEAGEMITFSEGEGAWVCDECAGETRR